jgi:hypothetical protein
MIAASTRHGEAVARTRCPRGCCTTTLWSVAAFRGIARTAWRRGCWPWRDEETVAAATAMARWARRHRRCGAAAELPAARRGKASAGEGVATGQGKRRGAAATGSYRGCTLGFQWEPVILVVCATDGTRGANHEGTEVEAQARGLERRGAASQSDSGGAWGADSP